MRLVHVDGCIRVQRHVTSAVLCDHLVQHGLGDPREALPKREVTPDPQHLIRKRKRQRQRYPYYDEKLKGCALLDMQTANAKAEAFITQQRDARDGAMSAQWRSRFRQVLGNAPERNANWDAYSISDFAEWDEDRPRITLDKDFKVRITAWIDDVYKAQRRETQNNDTEK